MKCHTMNYEIKIEQASEATGAIDLRRMAQLAEGIRKVSEGALQIRLKGVSLTRGRKKTVLQDALKVTLTSIKEGSTILCLETAKFENTLPAYQTDILRAEAQADLPNETPISLLIKSFEMALDDQINEDLLDKPLLRELKNMRKAFYNEEEKITISNQGSAPAMTLTKQSFQKIKVLEEELPDPEAIVLHGIVDLLQFSKLKVKIKTEDGIVDGFLSDHLSTENIAGYWGRKVTIRGIKHFKPRGKSVIEIQHIFESNKGARPFP